MSEYVQRKLKDRIESRTLVQVGLCSVIAFASLVAFGANGIAPKVGAANALAEDTLAAHPAGMQATASRTPTLTPTKKPSAAARAPSSAQSPQQAASQPHVDANTVALYHFDSHIGNLVPDATGHYTATLHGNAVITTSGVYSGSLLLDGNGSYVTTGDLGPLSQGTLEAFIDFNETCPHGWEFPILTATGPSGDILTIETRPYLSFGIYADGKWNWASSGINACRYLTGAAYLPFPYDPVTLHHVAVTWGPRGMEIWVDGVLHGVGNDDPNSVFEPYPYMCNPQQQFGIPPRPPNPNPPYTCPTPVMYPTMASFPHGDYHGDLPAYNTFQIGYDPSSSASTGPYFNGRIDELRISSVQRTFTLAVVPTPTPLPSQTPFAISGESVVDAHTLALYHFDVAAPPNEAWEEVSQQFTYAPQGNAVQVSNGRFSSGLRLDGNGSYLNLGNIGQQGLGTVEAWVRFSDSAYPFKLFVASYDNSNPALYLGDSVSGSIIFNVETDNQNVYTADSGITKSQLLGCWHHLAGTWGTRGLEIWIDGTLRATNPSAPVGMHSAVNSWRAGCDFHSGCIKGTLDDVRVSNDERSFTVSALAPLRGLYGPLRSDAQNLFSSGLSVFLPFIGIQPPPPGPTCLFGS